MSGLSFLRFGGCITRCFLYFIKKFHAEGNVGRIWLQVRRSIVGRSKAACRVYTLDEDIGKSTFHVDVCKLIRIFDQVVSEMLESHVRGSHVAQYRGAVLQKCLIRGECV